MNIDSLHNMQYAWFECFFLTWFDKLRTRHVFMCNGAVIRHRRLHWRFQARLYRKSWLELRAENDWCNSSWLCRLNERTSYWNNKQTRHQYMQRKETKNTFLTPYIYTVGALFFICIQKDVQQHCTTHPLQPNITTSSFEQSRCITTPGLYCLLYTCVFF